ncbi:RNA polymerase sigma factor [Dyadobacter diqingensis]|uniref:RNA polymerase sigma factor n=1 Tax=Dyadobacter diqingensis TaxID=2938121 RepID=UPI0020C19C5C|nr:sigma-70 family RNA polymerase sigma factor [Dyadobacter diqingensis]
MENETEFNDWYRITQGDEKAFMRLYETHYQALYSFGFRVYPDKDLIKDTIQEVFFELWAKRTELSVVQNPKAYLATFLKRKILKELEKKYISLSPEHIQSLVFERSYEDLLIEQQTDSASRDQLKKSLERLTPGQLEIIRLKYYEQLDYEQIAEQLQLQPRTVYNKVSEALKTLRLHLKVLSSLLFFLF